jgi:methyl coenzyme M reductase subunit D
MTVTSKVINIGFADAKDAEKKLNEILKNIENFIGYNIVNNGYHSSVIIFMSTDAEGNKVTPQVKIIPYSVTNPEEAEKTINEVLKDIDPVRLDVATPIDGNRLVILYDGTQT